jgi:putative SOS response-associated peptidase YedK
MAPSRGRVYAVSPLPNRARHRPQEAAAPGSRPLPVGACALLGQSPKVGNRMVNARAENVANQLAYRRVFTGHRTTIVPASAFYEWSSRPARAGELPFPSAWFLTGNGATSRTIEGPLGAGLRELCPSY